MRSIFTDSLWRKPETGLILATVLVPILLYVFYFGGFGVGRSSPRFWLIITLSLIYLVLALIAEPLYDDPHKIKMLLGVMLTIGLAINFLAEPGLLWIILLPLVGIGEEYLSFWERIGLYVVTLIGASGPYIIDDGFWDGLVSALFFFPALLFVIVFTRLMLSAEKERERAEALATDLASANRQLAEYAVQVEELATTQERNRIAREIHDTLGHYLTVVNVQLEAAKTVIADQPEKGLNAINRAQNMTREGLNAIRQSVAALRESPLDNRPLPEAIAQLVEENRAAGLHTEFGIKAEPRPLAPNAALTIYRVVQEGLTNIRKHADADHVDVSLDFTTLDQVQVEIVDNGVGATQTENGFGLLGIRERIHILGGRMQVETGPGEGFRLRVSLPG